MRLDNPVGVYKLTETVPALYLPCVYLESDGNKWKCVSANKLLTFINHFPARGFVNSILSSTTCFSVMEELIDGIAYYFTE